MEEFINDYIEMKYDNNILIAKFINSETYFNMELAKRLVRERIEFTKGEDHYLCLYASNFTYAGNDVRKFMSNEGAQNITAGAFIVNSAFSSVFFNFFIKVSGMGNKVPMKCFTSEESAIEWIEKLKKNHLIES